MIEIIERISADDSSPRCVLPLYDSVCVMCGSTLRQTVPDDREDRGICYSCYQEMWVKQKPVKGKRTQKAAAAG